MPESSIRVYHYLPARYALDDIRRGRLKIATFDALNDPFELWAVAQPDKNVRAGLRRWKKNMSRRYGVLCFCRTWQSPLLWGHYADKHRGMALGFDVPKDKVQAMGYVRNRPRFTTVSEVMAVRLLFTKFDDWSYEEELRICTCLKDRDPVTRLFFADFGKELVLREVIAGPLCETTKATIQRAVRKYPSEVQIIKARLAFKTFRVVKNQKGF